MNFITVLKITGLRSPNYSTLNIGTIDRFNSRLVRSFSYELGLAKNFNLEIEAEPFLIEIVDKMLDQIGENENISNSFMDYVDYSLENNERINLNKTFMILRRNL